MHTKQGESSLDTSPTSQGEGIADNSRPSTKPYKEEKWSKAKFVQGSFNGDKTASYKESENSKGMEVEKAAGQGRGISKQNYNK